VLLRDLVADPDLRLTLVDGERALDRPLTTVTTIDLLDPRRYLSNGALVLTGLMWHRGPADSEAFTEALAEFDVVALGAGEAALGSIPDDLVRACHRRGIALVSVPVETAFSQVSDRVAREQEAERGHRLAVARDRQRRLLSAVAEGRGMAALLHIVADEVGVVCRVMTPTGRDVAADGPPLPVGDLDRLARTFLLDRLPAVVTTSGGDVTVVASGSRFGAQVSLWFLVADGDHRTWSEDVRSAVDDLAAAVALERSRLEDARRVERRIADEVVDLVAAGRATTAGTVTRISDLGVDPAGPFLVAVAAFPDGPDLLDLARDVLHDAGLHIADLPVTGVHQNVAVALIPAAGAVDPAERVRAALERLAPGVRTRLAVGVSAATAPDALVGALDEARHAQRLAALRAEPVAVVTADEVTSHVLLLAAVSDDVRRAFATRVLGPVLDHDEQHGSQLIATVRAFIEADGSWSRCAAALHLHVNSVRYRIGRVEALTGRDLSRIEDRVDVFLALRSLPG
jgi:sugar diacid utilization regulator